MDIDVMAYVSKAIQGDLTAVAENSFDCVMCGLCSARCPAEEVQYNFAILARRLYARHLAPRAVHLDKAVENVEKKRFDKPLRELKSLALEELKKRYKALEIEPDIADEFWVPKDKTCVLAD
jgi:ferredoxin